MNTAQIPEGSIALPRCTPQSPSCGACGRETRSEDGGVDGSQTFCCEWCGLDFGDGASGTLVVYLDQRSQPCGNSCSNTWHGPDKIKQGRRYECAPCSLPADHSYSDHWNPCKEVATP